MAESKSPTLDDGTLYREPPDAIRDLIDAEPTPSFQLDPTRRWALLLEQPALPPIQEIARDEVKLAGLRFDPHLWTPSHAAFGKHPKLRRIIEADGETPVPLCDDGRGDLVIEGLPVDHGVRWLSFRPDSGAIAFVVRPTVDSTRLELWYACWDPSLPSAEQRCVAHPVPLAASLGGKGKPVTLQAVLGKPYAWTYDGRMLVKVVPMGHPEEPPTKPLAPTGPAVQEADGSKKKAARKYYRSRRSRRS